MPSKISFHIQQTANPIYLEKIICNFDQNTLIDRETVELSIQRDGIELSKGGVQRTINLALKMGILSKTRNTKYKFESLGIVLRKMALFKHDVYSDLIHFLLYSRWEYNNHQDYWSWSYSKICEMIWNNCPKNESNGVMFGQISSLAENYFPELAASLGEETIGVVKKWLKELEPPFFNFEGDKINCKERNWFSPELALLGIHYLYTIRKAKINTPILLDQSTTYQLAPLCLTSNETILSLVDIASKTYPFLEIHTGEWGSSAILKRDFNFFLIL